MTELYTDDKALGNRAVSCGVIPIGIGSIPIPDKSRQGRLNLEQQEDLPSNDEDSNGK